MGAALGRRGQRPHFGFMLNEPQSPPGVPVSFALLLLLLLPLGRSETVDRVLAVVGDRVITASDVELEEALAGHLDCPEAVLCDPSVPVLDRLMDIALVRGLAGDAATYRPSQQELERRLAAIRSSWTDPTGYSLFLTRFGLTSDDLAGFVYSRMVVEKYVQRNMTLGWTTGGDPSSQYREWISRQRAHVSSRRIAPLEKP